MDSAGIEQTLLHQVHRLMGLHHHKLRLLLPHSTSSSMATAPFALPTTCPRSRRLDYNILLPPLCALPSNQHQLQPNCQILCFPTLNNLAETERADISQLVRLRFHLSFHENGDPQRSQFMVWIFKLYSDIANLPAQPPSFYFLVRRERGARSTDTWYN